MKPLETSPATRLHYICDNESGVITNYSEEIGLMNNDVEYFFVEVMTSAGASYGIHAYGAEAIELSQVVKAILNI